MPHTCPVLYYFLHVVFARRFSTKFPTEVLSEKTQLIFRERRRSVICPFSQSQLSDYISPSEKLYQLSVRFSFVLFSFLQVFNRHEGFVPG